MHSFEEREEKAIADTESVAGEGVRARVEQSGLLIDQGIFGACLSLPFPHS